MNNQSDLQKKIDTILKDSTFSSVLSSSMGNIRPSKRRRIFIVLTTVVVFIYLSYAGTTEDGIINAIDFSNTIILALIAILVTGYAIFQALASPESLITFFSANVGKDKIPLFLEYQRNFFSLSIVYIVIVVFNYIILFIEKISQVNPLKYTLVHLLSCFNISVNVVDILLDVFLCMYFAILLNSIIELKSFIYGIYQAFNIASVAKIIDLSKDNKDKDNKNL